MTILTIVFALQLNAQKVYQVNNETTIIKWTGKKVAGEHSGKIKVQKGSLALKEGKLISGEIFIDMNSITCDDIEDKESNENLIGHLKNEDFFHSSFFPQAKLKLNKFVKLRNGEYKVIADLTIKGISKPLVFNSTINQEDSKLTANAKIIFDRTLYNIRYGSTLFGAAVDKAIDDNIVLEVHLEAHK